MTGFLSQESPLQQTETPQNLILKKSPEAVLPEGLT